MFSPRLGYGGLGGRGSSTACGRFDRRRNGVGWLVLVYLGAVANEYASFPTTDQNAVRVIFLRRAWFAVFGIVFSIAASGIALLAKWLGNSCLVGAAAILLAIALVWSVVIAVLLAAEIR